MDNHDKAAAFRARCLREMLADSRARYLKARERQKIDEAFLAMGNDAEYLGQMERMEAELAPLSDEAWLAMQREPEAEG